MYNKMKECPQCNKIKSFNNFYKNKTQKDGLSRICKECQSYYDNKNYIKNKEKIKETTKKSDLNKKEWYLSLKKGKKCIKCGDKRWYILDYHHLDPKTKTFNVGNIRKFKKSLILEEIKKCVLICKNCHSEFHYLEKVEELKFEDYLKRV